MKESAIAFIDRNLEFTREERRFLDAYYDDGRFDQDTLFGDLPVAGNLADHPVIVWRMQG